MGAGEEGSAWGIGFSVGRGADKGRSGDDAGRGWPARRGDGGSEEKGHDAAVVARDGARDMEGNARRKKMAKECGFQVKNIRVFFTKKAAAVNSGRREYFKSIGEGD
jgi:hypothetical protein